MDAQLQLGQRHDGDGGLVGYAVGVELAALFTRHEHRCSSTPSHQVVGGVRKRFGELIG